MKYRPTQKKKPVKYLWLSIFCFILATACVEPPGLLMTADVASRTPEKKDFTLLEKGISRTQVHKEFGHPAGTYMDRDTGALHDVFRFRQGYDRAKRMGVLAGNLATMGILGVGYVPKGTSMAINVQYDANNKVVSYKHVQ